MWPCPPPPHLKHKILSARNSLNKETVLLCDRDKMSKRTKTV